MAESSHSGIDYDYLIKFLALGDSGVGKTSLCIAIQMANLILNLFQPLALIFARNEW